MKGIKIYKCRNCGYETEDDLFECPKCGGVMEYEYDDD